MLRLYWDGIPGFFLHYTIGTYYYLNFFLSFYVWSLHAVRLCHSIVTWIENLMLKIPEQLSGKYLQASWGLIMYCFSLLQIASCLLPAVFLLIEFVFFYHLLHY